MLSIFRKKYTANVNLSGIGTDMHSHLLPGIDDGAPDIKTSIQLVEGMQSLGYKKFITTPHIMWDMYKNDETIIRTAQREFYAAQPLVPLKAAAEYYLDDHFDHLLESNEPLLTLKDNLVLVEFSFVNTPINLKEKLFNLQIRGYQPVLAHPERYLYFTTNRKRYDELKENGCYFQLNLLSLSGHYGKPPLELAHYLIKKKYIDFLGTDIHNSRHIELLRNSPAIM